MGAYRPLLSVSVEHAYFQEHICKTLEFIPAEPSVAMLKKTGLLIKSSESGISVFYEDDKMNILRLHAEDDLSLVFKVFSKDPNFFRYTIPGARTDSNLLFFNNQHITLDPTGKQMLHSDPNVTDKALIDSNAGPLEGMLNRKDYLVKPAFIVQMHITADARGLCSEELDVAARKFYIRFTTNQSFWKYYISGDLSKRNVYIADLDNAMQFNNAGNILLPGHREATLLQSSVAIPMQEQHHHRLQLRESGNMGDKVLIKRLPNANVNQMYGEVMNGQMENVSEIYIS